MRSKKPHMWGRKEWIPEKHQWKLRDKGESFVGYAAYWYRLGVKDGESDSLKKIKRLTQVKESYRLKIEHFQSQMRSIQKYEKSIWEIKDIVRKFNRKTMRLKNYLEKIK